MGDGEQVYLARPGGRREGPYTMEKVRQDLAARSYRDTDYWAWHDGLPAWVPLYALLSAGSATAAAEQVKADEQREVASGLPFAALERIFLFTTGEGPAAWYAPAVIQMLEATTGSDIKTIRTDVPRDVIGQCAAAELLKSDGSLSDAAWLAMASHQPRLVQQARERLLRVCAEYLPRRAA